MNILQNLEAPIQFCVTLNHTSAIDPGKIIQTINYTHPVFTEKAVAAQKRHREINGARRTYFCGAYWRYGFHEDGVVSAMDALEHFQRGPVGFRERIPMKSAIYAGQVRHRRMQPVVHEFSYRMFMMYLDLAELPEVFRGSLAVVRTGGRPSPVSAVKTTSVIRQCRLKTPFVISCCVETGRRPSGPIRLLTQLSYFGYVFNPVSFYYCYNADDTELETIVAEVNNTPWGERHCYVLSPEHEPRGCRSQALLSRQKRCTFRRSCRWISTMTGVSIRPGKV